MFQNMLVVLTEVKCSHFILWLWNNEYYSFTRYYTDMWEDFDIGMHSASRVDHLLAICHYCVCRINRAYIMKSNFFHWLTSAESIQSHAVVVVPEWTRGRKEDLTRKWRKSAAGCRHAHYVTQSRLGNRPCQIFTVEDNNPGNRSTFSARDLTQQ